MYNAFPDIKPVRYRAPDVLLGSRKYSTPVDIWSIGCIFAEMINGNPLFTGTSEDTQLDTIFRHLGTPDESTFPGISELPDWRSDFPNYPPPDSLHVLVPNLEQSGVELLQVPFNSYMLFLSLSFFLVLFVYIKFSVISM